MHRGFLVAAVLLAVLAVACDGAEAPAPTGEGVSPAADAASPTTSGSEAGAPATPAAAANADALDFTVPALDGGTLRGVDYAGQDVVLWMWAPW